MAQTKHIVPIENFLPSNKFTFDPGTGMVTVDFSGGGVQYKGTYNGTTITSSDSTLNGESLPSANVDNEGYYFVVTQQFTYSGTTYNPQDWIVSTGAVWDQVNNAAVPTLISAFTNDVGYITASAPAAWSAITGKPTTISGFGITDAYTKTQADDLFALDSNVVHINGTGTETVYQAKIFSGDVSLQNVALNGTMSVIGNLQSSTFTNQVAYWDSSGFLQTTTIAAATGYTPADDSNVLHLAAAPYETVTQIPTFSNSIYIGASKYEQLGILAPDFFTFSIQGTQTFSLGNNEAGFHNWLRDDLTIGPGISNYANNYVHPTLTLEGGLGLRNTNFLASEKTTISEYPDYSSGAYLGLQGYQTDGLEGLYLNKSDGWKKLIDSDDILNLVPYSGATGGVDLGSYDITANGFITKTNGSGTLTIGANLITANINIADGPTHMGFGSTINFGSYLGLNIMDQQTINNTLIGSDRFGFAIHGNGWEQSIMATPGFIPANNINWFFPPYAGNIPILNPAQITVGGTSGSAIFSQPFVDTLYKKLVVWCNNLTGAASFTFETPFLKMPVIVSTNGLDASLVTSLSTTDITVTGSSTTGFIIIEGY